MSWLLAAMYLIVDVRNGLNPKESSQWLRVVQHEVSAVWIYTVRERVFASTLLPITFNHDLDLCKYGTATNLSLNAACRSQALFMLLLSGTFCNLYCQPVGFIVFYTKFGIYVTKILHIHSPYLCVKTEIFKLDKNQTF